MDNANSGRVSGFFGDAGLILVGGAAAAAVTIALFTMRGVIGLSLLGAVLLALTVIGTGNPRLFFLVGLVMALPISLSKSFMAMPHHGGEFAIRIELADPFLAALCFYWFLDLSRGRIRTIHVPGAAVCWLLLILLGCLNVVMMTYKTTAGYEVIRMTKLLLLFLVIVNYVTREGQVRWIVGALLAGAVIQILYGIAQRVTGSALGLEKLGELSSSVTEDFGLATVSRVGAMLGHPNAFAGYLVMMLPLALAMLLSRISPFYKAVCVLVLLLGEVALVLTLSRAGWVSFGFVLAAMCCFPFVHPMVRRRAIVTRVLILAGIVVMGLLMLGPIVQKFVMSDPAGVSSRFKLLWMTWDMIKDHPVLGIGLNAYTYVVSEYDQSGIAWGSLQPVVHNMYFLVWAEQGTLGLLFYLGFLGLILRDGFRNFRSTNEDLFVISLAALAAFGGVLVQALADFTLRVNSCARVFMVMAALVVAIRYMNQRQEAVEAPVGHLVSEG